MKHNIGSNFYMKTVESRKAQTQPIWDEADELIRIFVTMSQNTQTRRDSK